MMNLPGNSRQGKKGSRIKRIHIFFISAGFIFLLQTFISSCSGDKEKENNEAPSMTIAEMFAKEHLYSAPDSTSIPKSEEGQMISYGRQVFIHTSKYFGPNGLVAKSHNGLNCQNCHLDAGTRPFGNNLAVVSTTYPKFLPRAGSILNTTEKINECFLRSLNGEALDSTTKEMKALVAYVNWLGKDVKKNEKFDGSGAIKAPKFIDRAADPVKGKADFEQLCVRCHGSDGQGMLVTDVLNDVNKQQGGTATKEDLYYYPPLWGEHSFNGVATLYRLSKLAGFIKYNMPYPATFKSPVLTDEQAWDIAAYVNSRSRPIKDHSQDYASDISKKPFDFPFGPYADNFTEDQHKFGPYFDIPSAKKAH